MTKLITFAILLSLVSVSAQGGASASIGDDYAKAAIRSVIAKWHYTGESAQLDRLVELDNEADAQAGTPAEQASFEALQVLHGPWTPGSTNATIARDRACFLALKKLLKARSGAIPDGCVVLK